MLHYRFAKVSDISRESIEKTLSLLSFEQKEYIRSLSDKKRVQSIGVRVLLNLLLEEFFCDTQVSSLSAEQSGRPILSGSNLYISFTHSGEYVGSAISNTPVGIDIECVREIKPSVINRVCSKEEIDYLNSHSASDFFTFWTLKEAYIKASSKKGKKLNELSFVQKNKISAGSNYFITGEIEGYKWSLINLQNF